MIEIKAIELTEENFKEFGYLLSTSKMKPLENTELAYWGKVAQLNMGETISTGILYGLDREPVIKSLERHINTPEILVAIEGNSIILFGKPKQGIENIDDLRAFYIKQGDAFAIHPKTWHWVAVPVGSKISKFLVVFASGTEEKDLEVRDLPEAIMLSL